jgi:hypothetical protein
MKPRKPLPLEERHAAASLGHERGRRRAGWPAADDDYLTLRRPAADHSFCSNDVSAT